MVAAALTVTDDQRAELARIAGASVLPHRQVVQARALLWAVDGVANEEIARRSGVDSDTVRRWRNRFVDKGIGGVGTIAKGRGRKSWLPQDTVQRVVELTLTGQPPMSTGAQREGPAEGGQWCAMARSSTHAPPDPPGSGGNRCPRTSVDSNR